MRTGADKDQFGFRRLVDQKPIARYMAFAVANIISDQQMIAIAIAIFQSFPSLQRPDDLSQLLKVSPGGMQFLEVFLEAAFSNQF
jgi:hypothetical protein